MAVFDSSAIIHFLEHSDDGDFLREKTSNYVKSTTTVSVYEVMSGRNRHDYQKALDLINDMDILLFDTTAAQKAVELRKWLMKRGRPLSTADLFIAAICMSRRLALLTCDKDFLDIPGLDVILVR